MADFNNENQNGVFGGFGFQENKGVTENSSFFGETQQNNNQRLTETQVPNLPRNKGVGNHIPRNKIIISKCHRHNHNKSSKIIIYGTFLACPQLIQILKIIII